MPQLSSRCKHCSNKWACYSHSGLTAWPGWPMAKSPSSMMQQAITEQRRWQKAVLVPWWWCSVAQSCVTLWDPMDCSTPGFLSFTTSWSLLKLMPVESVMPSNHLILCHPLLLPPSIFSSIRVFSNESALRIRWPKYWSFNFSISSSNEYPGLIYLWIDWFDLDVQGTILY